MNKVALGVCIALLILQLAILAGYPPQFSTASITSAVMGIVMFTLN